MAEEEKAPQEGQPESPKPAPATPEAGKVEEPQAAPSIPDKFQGKQLEEVVKSYSELEKEHGKSAKELGELRTYKEQMDFVLNTLSEDPDLYNKVDSAVRKKLGQPEPTAENKPEVRDDMRRTVEAQVIGDFEQKYGVNNLEPEKKQEMHRKIGAALAELLDPGGKKSVQEIINDVPLDRLNRYLENAYFLANRDQLVESAKMQALTQSREAEYGAIGGIPSSGGNLSDVTLTPLERETARKMKISEEKYLERKKQIATESKGV